MKKIIEWFQHGKRLTILIGVVFFLFFYLNKMGVFYHAPAQTVTDTTEIWARERIQHMKDSFMTVATENGIPSSIAEKYSDCLIGKCTSHFAPSEIAKQVQAMKDSGIIWSNECLNEVYVWNEEMLSSLRESFIKETISSGIPKDYAIGYSDYVVAHVKNNFTPSQISKQEAKDSVKKWTDEYALQHPLKK